MFEGISSALQGVFKKLRGGGRLTEENLSEIVRVIRRALIEADVNHKVAKEFCARVKESALGEHVLESVSPEQQFVKIIHDHLVELLGGEIEPFKFSSSRPTVIMVAGLNGAGKTTTCAKLALLLRRKLDKDPVLVAADLQRPAAVEQLVTLGRQLDVAVYEEGAGGRPPKVAQRGVENANKTGHDVVIVDTAGRLQIDEPLMLELAEVKAKIKPDYTLLVCDGMTGQDAVNSAKGFDERLDIDGVILTKLDGDTRGGAALSIKAVTGKPIRYLGTGEKLENIEEFHADRMAGRILGMGDIVSLVEDAARVIEVDQAEEQLNKLLSKQFTLDDFMQQLAMIKRMGSMKDMLKKLPTGALGVPADALDDFDESEMKYIEAIIQSMTPRERNFPEIIDKQRRWRIAEGSGTTVARVNDLLKSFKVMQRQFKDMTESGMLGKLMGSRMEKKKYKKLEKSRKSGRPGKKGRRSKSGKPIKPR